MINTAHQRFCLMNVIVVKLQYITLCVLMAMIASSVFQSMTSLLRLFLLLLISSTYLYLVFGSHADLFGAQELFVQIATG